MANLVKSYFLPPAWHYRPGASIFLGSIISDARAPQNSLNANTVAKGRTLEITLDDVQKNFQATIYVSKQRAGGVLGSFLSMLGIGGDLTVQKENQLVYKLEAQELRTQEINPSASYIESSLQSLDAGMFLRDTQFRQDLYIIVGLMVGLGVSISSYESSSKGVEAHLGVSGAPAGVPLEVGPKYSTSSNDSLAASFDATSAIILGYSLKRITYMKKTRSFRTAPMAKGAVLSRDRPIPEDDDEAETYAKFVSLDDDIIGAEEFDLQSVTADEESRGDRFEFVMPH